MHLNKSTSLWLGCISGFTEWSMIIQEVQYTCYHCRTSLGWCGPFKTKMLVRLSLRLFHDNLNIYIFLTISQQPQILWSNYPHLARVLTVLGLCLYCCCWRTLWSLCSKTKEVECSTLKPFFAWTAANKNIIIGKRIKF